MRYVFLVLALVASGCVADGSGSAPAAATDEGVIARVRDDFSRSGVSARVAAVSEVLADQPFLSATGTDAGDFPVGSIITVSDTKLNTLAHGRVVALVGSDIHASFVVSGSRGPKAGDIIVRFP